LSDELPEHPGFIEYVEGATGEVTKRVRAEDEPEDIAYAPGPDGKLQPVTRIVHFRHGDRHEIHMYGADGTLLKTIHS